MAFYFYKEDSQEVDLYVNSTVNVSFCRYVE